MLAGHRTQHGLGQLAGGVEVILHLDDGLGRIDHAQIDHGTDLDRHVVPGNHILGRHLQHNGAQIDPHHLLDGRDDDHQPRPLHLPETAQGEHHAPLVLAEDADRRKGQHHQQHHDDAVAAEDGTGHSGFPGHEPLLRTKPFPFAWATGQGRRFPSDAFREATGAGGATLAR
ncbi:hypothetical protein SDC9_179191 [bioreactor metagenome]|uniref:Uncharacterized protein n=1 Tax=bioreactor metagenome TaxID=1076179 RepID=A0A645GYA6_9ZZZZ